MLGWSNKYNKEIFDGVMEGINVDERVYFSCDRVDNTRAINSNTTANTRKLSFGKGKGVKLATEGLKSELPKR